MEEKKGVKNKILACQRLWD